MSAESGDDDGLGAALLARARNAIGSAFGRMPQVEPAHRALRLPGATFVSLHIDGELRGCIGRLEAARALEDDVRANAAAAAFADPRFAPLTDDEFDRIDIEVSVLEPAQRIDASSEAQAIAALQPDIDGVILEWRGRHATFLPQVWASLPDRHDFLAALRQKAGLDAGFWSPDIALSRYRVRAFHEPVRP